MPITINVNNLTLCHKGSNGFSTATIPDVCKTPSPGGPVPIPYPNIAMSMDLMKGTTTVKADGGMMCANYGSEFFKSTGDEPGVAGGVISNTYIKEATWITFSFDVKLQGKAACRLTDKMFHNHQNTVNMSGLAQCRIDLKGRELECLLLYESLINEAKAISDDGGDPLKNGSEVNRRITSAYSEMYQRRPDLHWTGAATFVSKQMGCNMREADSKLGMGWLKKTGASLIGNDVDKMAKSSKELLVKGNQAIFNDIYPQYRLYEVAPDCATTHGAAIGLNPKMVEGFECYQRGDSYGGMLAHADYEQNIVLQQSVFGNASLSSKVSDFDASQTANSSDMAKIFGEHTPEQVSFSSGCVASGDFYHSTLPGTFSNQSDRWTMATDVLDKYDDLMTGQSQSMLDSIKEIGKNMSTGKLPTYPK
jgi:hypothetical protein